VRRAGQIAADDQTISQTMIWRTVADGCSSNSPPNASNMLPKAKMAQPVFG